MPNWCSTKIEFTGNFADLTDLHNKIVQYTSSNAETSGFGEPWLGNVLIGFGFGDRINNPENIIRCRGWIDDIGNVTDRQDKSSFDIFAETAWIPMIKMWREIIARHYDNRISIHWIAEEKDGGLYITDDIGWFGTDYYHVEWSIGEDEDYEGDYFDGPDEVAEHINGLIAKYDLGIDLITEKDINTADDEGKNIYLRGNNWYIGVIILKEANDNDVK